MGSLVAELAEKLSSATNNLDFDEQTLFLNTSADTVGIGTNAPDGKFDVRQSGTDDIMNLYDGTAVVFTVRDGGNVGIGTDVPGRLVDLYQDTGGADIPLLLVRNTDSQVNFLQGVHALFPSNQGDGSTERTSIGLAVGTAFTNGNAGYIGFTSNDSDNAANRLTFGLHSADNLMCITNAGNVGIGTTAPGLNAGGVAAIDPFTNFSGTLLHIDNTGGDATLIIGGSDQPNLVMVDGNSSANKRYYHQTVLSDVYKFRLLNDAGSLVNDNVLVLDGHNARVGIGTSAPDYPLHLATATVNVGQIIQGSYNNNANPNLTIQKSNGSIASPTAITSGHYCGQIRFNSYDGNSWHGSADIVCATSGTVADGRVAGDLRFRTAPDSVAGVSERMRITHHGRVGIGTTDPNSPLTVNLNYTSGAVCSFYQQYASQTTLYVKNSSASFAASMQYQITELNDSANGNFCWYSDTNDVKIKMNTNGDGWWDGAADNGSADYAEYFEADSDNSSAKISHGTTVVLINGKIRPATSGEQPIGIIRPHDGVAMVGNSAWSRWQRKGLRDDYGKKI